MADRAIRSGDHDLVLTVGFDKHPPGAFDADPEASGLGRWYGETGLMLTTQFFAMKIQRYMHELRDLAGRRSPRWRRRPTGMARAIRTPGGDSSSPSRKSPRRRMISHPLTKYMFCSPARAAWPWCCAGPTAPAVTPISRCTCRRSSFRTRKFGSFEVFSPWLSPSRADGPSTLAARAVFEAAGVGPPDVDVIQLQDTESGAEIMHMAETGFCKDGEQETLIQAGATEIGGPMPVNTDGGCLANGEPIGASGLRQVYESVLQLRGAAGDRQVPGDPQVAFTHVYGAPGISSCAVLTR